MSPLYRLSTVGQYLYQVLDKKTTVDVSGLERPYKRAREWAKNDPDSGPKLGPKWARNQGPLSERANAYKRARKRTDKRHTRTERVLVIVRIISGPLGYALGVWSKYKECAPLILIP